jgi:transglutaminase-like putative cysteine protease
MISFCIFHQTSAMKYFLLITLACISVGSFAQDYGFPFGRIALRELEPNLYEKDTSASAVYLEEFGETSFDNGDNYNLVHKYHARIKVVKTKGVEFANFEIPLYRSGMSEEKIRSLRATSFSMENGSMRETPLDPKNIFTENTNKYWQVKKFAVPNVKAGSVIEVEYAIETPFFYNFKSWQFQSSIPKVKSEYVAIIPAVYTYNISLSGFLKLSKNESKIVRGCLGQGSPLGGGFTVDCSHFTYGMVNVPAFREEDYMTAKKNFISAIHFELAEIRTLNGGVDKITMEWKDAEYELKKHDSFGLDLKRNGDLLEPEITALVAAEVNPLEKAKKIYRFVQQYFVWDGFHDKYSDGIKKAVQNKKGNIADINLFLVGALRKQKLDASPVILSTRDNGMANDLYPVLSSFNYVIAAVNIDGKTYLLDATDDFHPFGMLPEKCLNGKGRLLHEDGSSWVELKPADRGKNVLMVNAKLGTDGVLRGTLETTYMGYEAVSFRKQFFSHADPKDYQKDLQSKLGNIEIKKMEIVNADNYTLPVVRKLEVEIPAFDDINSAFLFNPYLLGKWKENPFKSTERLYPVDFGAPIEMVTIVNLEYPAELELVNVPSKVGLSLPNAGGRYIVDANSLQNKLTLTNSLQINKTVFSSQEYHYLRELFQKIIEVQNTDLMFKKRS